MPGQPAVGSNQFITFDVSNDIKITEASPGLLDTPSNIIPKGKEFSATIRFSLGGLFADFISGTKAPYSVTLRYESIGDGPEGSFPAQTGALEPAKRDYEVTVKVSPDTLPVGVYQLAAVVTFTGSSKPPLNGYVSGQILEVYEP
jgi:hypothetical protein